MLFNWQPDNWRDFYFRIADEAPVSTVYLGEVICFKRAPLFDDYREAVAARLKTAGKTVVVSTLSEVMSKQERKMIDEACADAGVMVEANDGSALLRLRGRPHHAGPFVNVYNEHTVAALAKGGLCNVCLPPEMPATAIAVLRPEAAKLGVSVEVQVFGRIGLALSARCYHARAHGRTKDSCQFICNEDPDGMPLRTLEDKAFLTVNGIQTISHEYLNLIGELAEMQAMGVTRFRLSPHSCDMVAGGEHLPRRARPPPRAGRSQRPLRRAQARCAVLRRLLPWQARSYLEWRRPALTAVRKRARLPTGK